MFVRFGDALVITKETTIKRMDEGLEHNENRQKDNDCNDVWNEGK